MEQAFTTDYDMAWTVGVVAILVLCGMLWAYGHFWLGRKHKSEHPEKSEPGYQ